MNRTRMQLSGGVGEMSPGATILPAGLRLALEGTVDGVHQEAEQATVQGLGEEVPGALGLLDGEVLRENVPWGEEGRW